MTPTMKTAWSIESLRLTTFHAAPLGPETVDWWKVVAGTEPDTSESKRATSERTEIGSFAGGQLVLHIALGRCDWHLVSPIIIESPTTSLGSVDEAIGLFPIGAFDLIRSRSDVLRIAFGTVAFLQAEGRRDGYSQLQAYLPSVKLDPEGSSDFLYQINRSRQTTLESGRQIIANRVSKWSVRMISLTTGLESGPPGASAHISIARPSVEIDVNSAGYAENAYTENELKELYGAAREMTAEILRDGDVP